MMWLLFACSNDSTSDFPTNNSTEPSTEPIADSVTYYQDVAPILANNCVSCHREEGSGPFVLDTYEMVKATAGMIEDSVTTRRMPPFHVDNSGDCHSFEHSPWLSDDEISTIATWVANDTPEGTVADISYPSFEEAPFEGTHSVTFEPYNADFATAADDYRCFIVDPQVETEGFLTGFEVLPSNRAIAHHMILYAPASDTALEQAYDLDEADSGPGYACYGDPRVDNRMIAPWAPGSDQWFYPDGTGVRMEKDQILILQMHYSNASEETLDSTTVNLNITDSIDKELYTSFFVNSSIAIPPGETEHLEKTKRTVQSFSGYNGPLVLHAMGPHMHKLGVSGSASLTKNGEESCLMDVPYYDFNWQRVYTYSETVTLQPDDLFELNCTYDSTSQSETVQWGDGTGDEMCLMTVFASLPQ